MSSAVSRASLVQNSSRGIKKSNLPVHVPVCQCSSCATRYGSPRVRFCVRIRDIIFCAPRELTPFVLVFASFSRTRTRALLVLFAICCTRKEARTQPETRSSDNGFITRQKSGYSAGLCNRKR